MAASITASATLAEIYLEQGYIDECISLYTELVRREPDNKAYAERLKYLKKQFKASQKKGVLKNLRNKLWQR